MFLLLFACTSGDPTDTSDTTDTGPTGPQPPTPAAYEGTCPDISGERFSITSAEIERDVLLLLPEEPTGAPVWFAWHWLGGTAAQAIRFQGLQAVADAGYIVVAPNSREDELFEWAFAGSDPTADLALFDDLVSCLHEQHQVDLSRLYTNGMSAGGLWSTYLLMNRSEVLAAAAPFSGGTGNFQQYTAPTRQLPVLLTWGGPEDLYGGLSFHDATLELSAELQGLDHWVAHCEHTGGHNLPPNGTEAALQFFGAHTWGEPSPWVDGLPADFAMSFCALPE